MAFEPLEPRVLASADAGALPLPLPAVRQEVAFVDARVAGLREAVEAWAADQPSRAVTIVAVDAERDGLTQIAEVLASRTDTDAIHLFTHGRAGAIEVGATLLTPEVAWKQAAVLGRWHQILRPGTDLLLYGCDVAGNPVGIHLMETLGALTGTDVAASTNATGAAGRDGDWILERQVGIVETAAASLADWDATLQLVAEDPFVTSGLLEGATGGSGWAGAWTTSDSSRIRANGAGLADPGGLLAETGGSVRSQLTTILASATATRSLATPVGTDGTTTWFGFLLQVGDTGSSSAYAGLRFGNGGGTEIFAGYNGNQFVIERFGGLGTVAVSGVTPVTGQTYFLAVSLASVAGNDTLTLHVGPTPGMDAPDSAFTAVKTDVDVGSFSQVGFAVGRGLSASSVEFDELRIGARYADVAPSLVVDTTADTNASGITPGNATQTVTWLISNRVSTISLREALIAANNTAGTNRISFQIPGSLVSGRHTIALTSALPPITDAVILDGTTEQDYGTTPLVFLDGSALAGTPSGLVLQAAGNTVQGLGITGFAGAGISVAPAASAAILSNLITGTGGPGIDLNTDTAVQANDGGDGDAGANDGLNFPVIYSALLSGGTVTVTGEARPGTVVQFFEADTQASNHGGATSFIGTGTVAASGTPGTSDATAVQFSFSFAQGSLVLGDELTATATESSARTSEFAQNAVVTEPNVAPVLDASRSPALAAELEDAGAPAGAAGTAVSQLVDFASPSGQVDNVTDANTSPLLGIAITTADTTQGTWWYTTDGGTQWHPLGTPSAGAARLLAADAQTRVAFQPTADFAGTLAIALTFRAWDRTSGTNGTTANTTTNGGTTAFSSATDTASLVVTAIDDPPVIGAIANQTLAEDGTTGALAFTLSDVDSALAGLTLSASSSNTVLVPNAGLVLGGSGASRTLTVTPAANANGGPVTVTISASDATTTVTRTFTVTVTAQNDPPSLTAPATLAGHQDTVIVFSAGSQPVSVADIDAGTAPIEVALTADHGGTLTLDSVGGLVFSAGDGTADASMTFSGTLATVNAALDGMRYTPGTSYNGPASLAVSVSDLGASGSGGALGATATIALTIAPSAAPVLALSGGGVTYTEGSPAVVLDSGLVLSDADSTHAQSALLEISDGYRQDQDRLDFSDQSGITGTWNAALGTLALSGAATLADYQAALRSVRYLNTSDAPNETARTVTLRVSDTGGSSTPVTRSISVAAVNDPPAMSLPSPQATLEDTALTFSVTAGNAITIADPDAGSGGARITLSVTAGTLTLAQTTGIVFGAGANGTGTMAIAGTVADLNAALDGLVFQPAANAHGNVVLSAEAYDFGNHGGGGPYSDTETLAITVTSVNDAPQGTDRTVTVAEDATLTFGTADFALSESADSPANALAGALISTLPGTGTLALGGTAVSAGQFVSAADLAAGRLTYAPPPDANGAGYANFSFRIRDDGGTANGGVDTDPTANTMTIDVTAVNDATTATGLITAEAFTEDTPLDLADIVVADIDSATVTVTLTLSDPAAGALSVATNGSTTSAFAAGVWQAAGPVSEVNALLANVTFVPAANYASSFVLQTSASDGIAAAVTGSKPVTAVAIDDPPAVTAIADQGMAEDTATAPLAFTLSDPDTAANALTVTVSSSDLSRVASSGLVLGGSGALRTLTVTPVANAFGGPVRITLTVADGTSTVQTGFDITITATNDPITLGVPVLRYARDAGLTLGTADFPVEDPDGPAGPVVFSVRNITGGRFEQSAAPGIAVATFSAVDLANGAVRFIHSAGDTPPAFEISATDGTVTTAFRTGTAVRVITASELGEAALLAAAGSQNTSVPSQSAPPAAAPEPVTERSEATAPASRPASSREPVLQMAVPRTPAAKASKSAGAAANPEAEGEQAGGPDAPPATATASSQSNTDSGSAKPGSTPSALVAGSGAAPAGNRPADAVMGSGGLAPGRPGTGTAADQPRAAEADPVALEAHRATLRNPAWQRELDGLREQADSATQLETLTVGSGAAAVGTLSVGYVAWLLRGGALLSGLLSALPAWQTLDPLPVLSRQRRDDDEEALRDPLERLFSRAQALGRLGRQWQWLRRGTGERPAGAPQPPTPEP